MASMLKVRLLELGRKLSWVCHCLRQLDHVAAQRVRRTQQWVAFNNRIWPSECFFKCLQSIRVSHDLLF